MLRIMTDLHGFSISALDGLIGSVRDVYFDDEAWVIRYFVVETGGWFHRRKLLISPVAIDKSSWQAKTLLVSITKDQVQSSPDIDTERPVSRQHELSYLDYYGYAYYWSGGGLWGRGAHPGDLASGLGYGGSDVAHRRAESENTELDADADLEHRPHDDHHLRSCDVVMTYRVQATDGEIGSVHDLLIDANTWAIRYLIVNTGHWWLGHKVVIPTQWITAIRWDDNTISVDLTRDAVRGAPPYQSDIPFARTDEETIHRHYGRRGYWAEEVQQENPEFHVV